MTSIHLVVFFILLVLTAFFVISEFSIVRVRRARVEYLSSTNQKRASALKQVVEDLNTYLSACQLGITLTALAMGWIGEPAIGELFHSAFGVFELPAMLERSLASIVAFLIITYINVVFGELAPKTLAIQKTETLALLVARPLLFFHKLSFPFIWLLNSSSNIVSRVFGVDPDAKDEIAHSEEELRYILSESYREGEINQSEYRFVNKIFEFDDRMAREIMIPRTEMTVVYKNEPFNQNLEVMRNHKFTRYPVAEKDKDSIVGLINMKELVTENLDEEIDLTRFLRPTITVLETMKIKQLLFKMQKERIHMAILVDEYGGTAGLVTVEDILEEIVGEIRDEFDDDEKPMIQQKGEDRTIIDGKVLITEINALFGLEIDHSEIDTIGGWMLSQTTRIEPGTIVTYDSYKFQITDVEGYQVKQIEVSPK
ncbi:MAG TPA: hemolysin family protein [Bacillales bacterium]|nr:hemolysin family protein [Bacillales bacterium]